MQDCPSCGELNHSGADRCTKCGAWFSRGADGAPAESPPPRRPAPRELPPQDTFEGRVLHLLQQGQNIPAIKLWRKKTGAGLKEAKDAVEALGRRHGLKIASGCRGAATVLCALAVLTIVVVWKLIVE